MKEKTSTFVTVTSLCAGYAIGKCVKNMFGGYAMRKGAINPLKIGVYTMSILAGLWTTGIVANAEEKLIAAFKGGEK